MTGSKAAGVALAGDSCGRKQTSRPRARGPPWPPLVSWFASLRDTVHPRDLRRAPALAGLAPGVRAQGRAGRSYWRSSSPAPPVQVARTWRPGSMSGTSRTSGSAKILDHGAGVAWACARPCKSPACGRGRHGGYSCCLGAGHGHDPTYVMDVRYKLVQLTRILSRNSNGRSKRER